MSDSNLTASEKIRILELSAAVTSPASLDRADQVEAAYLKFVDLAQKDQSQTPDQAA